MSVDIQSNLSVYQVKEEMKIADTAFSHMVKGYPNADKGSDLKY